MQHKLYVIDYGEGTARFITPYQNVTERFLILAKINTAISNRLDHVKIIYEEPYKMESWNEWNEKLALNFDIYYWRNDGARMRVSNNFLDRDQDWDESYCDICGYKELFELTIDGYQKEALRTINTTLTDKEQLQNGLMGLNGEAGECIDILKKHLFQDHEFDKEHLAKELGDVAWYLAVSAWALGYSLEDIFRLNIKKLQKRYPIKFDVEQSVNREENDI